MYRFWKKEIKKVKTRFRADFQPSVKRKNDIPTECVRLEPTFLPPYGENKGGWT